MPAYAPTPRSVRLPDWFRAFIVGCSSLVCVVSSLYLGLSAHAASPDYRALAIGLAISCLITVASLVGHFRMVRHGSRWLLAMLGLAGLLSYAELLLRALAR